MKRLLLSFLILPGIASAQLEEVPSDKRSGNYDKAQKLLPGETVVTPTGQRIKVWSTQGPVEVSPAPEPFAKPNGGLPDGVGVITDERRRRDRNSDDSRREKAEQ